MDLEKSELRIQKLKCNFLERLKKNSYTNQIINAIGQYYDENKNKKMNKKSFLHEIQEIVSSTLNLVSVKSKEKLSDIESQIKLWSENSLVGKIKTTLDNENSEELEKLTNINFSQLTRQTRVS